MDERDRKKYLAESAPSLDEDEKIDTSNWIEWFCNIDGHEFFCQVPEDFIRDSFNLFGLRSVIPKFDEAICMILAKETPDDDDFEDDTFNDIYQSAIDLYGQLHARFILSSRGLEIMKEKYLNGDFGICPRLYCDEQPVIPIGLAKEIREEGVRTYCPRCKEAYIPSRRYENVDGVCFGSSFPLILLESHTELYPEEYNDTVYIPKIFGYKIYKRKGSAYYEKYTEKIEETKDLEESML